MSRKNITSLHLLPEDRAFLERDGKPFAVQLRLDLARLQRLEEIMGDMAQACQYVLDWAETVHGRQDAPANIQTVLRLALALADKGA